MFNKLAVLKSVEMGARVAEDEADSLEKYFVETDQWQQMRAGKIDVVYGPKGSGKSALYTLLNRKEDEFFDNGVLLASGENLRGATVFRSIVSDPPPSELAFIYLWKLYCLILIANVLRDYEISNKEAKRLVESLEKSRLLPAASTLSALFNAVKGYLKKWTERDARSIEHAITVDPSTGAPTVSRKTEFLPMSDDQNLGEIPVDDLLASANSALEEEGLNLWVLFDRLDVAFADSPDLERNAIRALFRAYNDIKAYPYISLKIFVRDDIWRRVAEGGFTEASHITKYVNISWSDESLLNLVVLRIISNPEILKFLNVDAEEVRSDYERQREVFYRLSPDQVDTGKNPETFGWIVSRTKDGTGNAVPREVIHLMDMAKTLQIQKLERGVAEPDGEQLFDRASFKEALSEVSKTRYEQTLLAEYPDMLSYLERLENEKCEQNLKTLSGIWELNVEEATEIAKRLSEIGFFESRGTKEDPIYWVPFLYRSALDMVQGKAG